jgi:hypothetical protein
MIYCTFKWFTDQETGKREYLLDRAEGENGVVVLPCGTPQELGAVMVDGQWVIRESKDGH